MEKRKTDRSGEEGEEKKKNSVGLEFELLWKKEEKKKSPAATPEAHLQVGKGGEEERSHHFVSAKKEGKSPGKK